MEFSQSVTGGSDPDYISIMSPGFETWRKEIRSHSHHNVLSDRHGGWSGNDGTKDRVHDRREAHEYDRGHGFFRNNGIPCKYFAAGNCRNGENCWFSHDGPGSCNLDLEVKSRRGPNWSDTSVTPDVANDQRSCVSLNNRENSLAGPMWNGKAAGQNLCKIPHLTKNNSANMAVGESVYGSKPIDNVDTSVTEAVMGNNPLYINRVVDRQFPQDFQLYGNGQLSQLYTAVNLPSSIGMVPSQPTPAAVGINTPNQTTLSKRPCDPRVNFQQASPIVTPSKPPGCSPSTVEQNRVAEQMPLKGSVPSSLKDDFSEKKRKHQFHELEKLESVAACEAGVKSDKVDQRKKDRNNHLEDMDVNIQVEECKRSKDVKSIRMFKFALVDFVKDIIKPTWKAGQMSKEAHNTIVKKVVDKVIATIEEAHVPRTKEEIDLYLAFCKPKILKFVQAYVERYLKSSAVAGKP